MSDDLDGAAFEALLRQSAGSLVLVLDARLRLVRAGQQAESLADRPAAELAGMSLIAAFGSAGLDGIARQAMAAGQPLVGEAELGRPVARIFAVDALPLDGNGLVLALRDISAQRRAERVRRDFVANISHELRTPLASVKLLAETLSGGTLDDPATARDFVIQIERETDHLAQLVDELLDLTLIESGELQLELEQVQAAAAIAGVADRIGPVAERMGISLRLTPMPERAEGGVLADSGRLGQALLNLAHNAVKYSHRGGEVRLGWEPRDVTVRFLVSDDGIGIPAVHQDRVFERFYKVDRSRARTADDPDARASAGLGLAIVRHLVEAHGGRVGVESREGAGSTFWLEIPRAG